jgi:hypothetical protein
VSGPYNDGVHDRLQFGSVLRRGSGIVRALDDDALAIDIEDPEGPTLAQTLSVDIAVPGLHVEGQCLGSSVVPPGQCRVSDDSYPVRTPAAVPDPRSAPATR